MDVADVCSRMEYARYSINKLPSDVARFSDQGGPRKYLGGPHCRNSNQIKTEWGNKTRTDRGFNKFCLSFIAK